MRTRPGHLLLAALGSLLAACGEPPPTGDWEPLPEPTADEVDAVVFLVGDAGEALPGHSPVLGRMGLEVESWARRLGRDSAVAVAYLGDIVYPVGVRPPGSEHRVRDSLVVEAQVGVVAGPAAREHQVLGLFTAGNHDWGGTAGVEGIAAVENLERILEGIREARDLPVALLPEAGAPGPATVDVGERARYVAMDTHWWLQSRNELREDSVLLAVADVLGTAGEREIIFWGHHPWQSGGAHGGPMPIWEGLGLLWLLRQSGALIQDLNSLPYQELRLELQTVFRDVRAPYIWAGGHDHSLQVIETGEEQGYRPRWSLVSGSGSKLTDVKNVRGMLFGTDRPGFMRLTHLRDGRILLHVYAAPQHYLLCEGPEEVVAECMERGVPAFEVVYARRLR